MRLRLLILTAALVVLVAACGDDSDTDVGSDDPVVTTSTLPDDDDPDDGNEPDDTDEPTDRVDPDDGDEPIDGDDLDLPDEPVDGLPDGPILGAGPYPIADLTMTVTLVEGGEPATYRVACLGDTATLSGDPAPGSADRMCLALNQESVRTRIVDGDTGDRACTEQYGGPQTATITGTFDGSDVDTSFHRADGCGIGDWELLAGVLPTVT